jgi:hypothetical protein
MTASGPGAIPGRSVEPSVPTSGARDARASCDRVIVSSPWRARTHLGKVQPMPTIEQPISVFEQRFAYRVREYLAGGRSLDAEFSLPGLRSWMLCQRWPDPDVSLLLECLAVLSWSAICQAEAMPDDEFLIRQELARQLNVLEGLEPLRPPTLDIELSMQKRTDTYADLRKAAEPGSSRRELWGLPRFNAAENVSR